MILILLFAKISAVSAYENPYPLYWKGNKNFPLVYGFKGRASYLDKNSIEIKVNEPPFYIIFARVLSVSHADTFNDDVWLHGDRYFDKKEDLEYRASYILYKRGSKAAYEDDYEFFYDEEMLDMRVRSRSNDSENKNFEWSEWWVILPYLYSNADGLRWATFGESIFYVTQRRKFYGDYLWKDILKVKAENYNENNARYDDFFVDGIYERL